MSTSHSSATRSILARSNGSSTSSAGTARCLIAEELRQRTPAIDERVLEAQLERARRAEEPVATTLDVDGAAAVEALEDAPETAARDAATWRTPLKAPRRALVKSMSYVCVCRGDSSYSCDWLSSKNMKMLHVKKRCPPRPAGERSCLFRVCRV